MVAEKPNKKQQQKSEKARRAEFMSLLPAQYSLLSQDDQVKALIDRSVRSYLANPEGFSKDAFFIELDNLPYFQKFSKAAIADMDLQNRLPEVWEQQVTAEVDTLRDMAVQYGSEATDEELRELAVRKRRMGLNESQLRNAMATTVKAKEGIFAGQAGQIQRGLKNWARMNGVGLSDGLISTYVNRIQSGDTTEEDALADLRRTYVAGAYPAWADRIDQGMDIADIAAPYRSTMAKLLEVDEEAVDLNDPLLRTGLQGVGPDGKPRVVPLYEFEKQVRKDPRWDKTNNAYASYAKVGTDLLQMFGLR